MLREQPKKWQKDKKRQKEKKKKTTVGSSPNLGSGWLRVRGVFLGSLCDRLGVHLVFFGPKVVAETKIREGVGSESSPGCLGAAVTEVISISSSNKRRRT